MTTKTDLIAQCKIEHSTITEIVNDVERELNEKEYNAVIEQWAEMRLTQIAVEKAQAEAEAAKAAAQAKLATLGLTTDDLKALGL